MRSARARRARAEPSTEPDPDLLRIYEFVSLVAASARSGVQRERVRRAAGVPLTAASRAALRLVQRHGPIAVNNVASGLGIDQSTASRQLRPLDEHGLVARTTDPEDRRIAKLTITEEGRRVVERIRDVSLNDFEVALGDWSGEDRTRLADLLERFRVSLLQVQVDDTGWAVPKR